MSAITPYTSPNPTPVPLNATEAAQRSYEQKYHVEDRLALSLANLINQGILERISQGALHYRFTVPSFVQGFPRYDVMYIANRLEGVYQQSGYMVDKDKACLTFKWHRATEEPCPSPPRAQACAPTLAEPPKELKVSRVPL